MGIDNIVSIAITQATSTVSTVSTTVPLILGTTNPGWEDGDYVHGYSTAADLLSDGFSDTSPEYIHALALTAQKTVPSAFLVGRRTGSATAGEPQIDNVTVSTVTGQHVYRLSLNGQIYSYTSQLTDTGLMILQGLAASITADSAALVTPSISSDQTTLVLTGKVDGQSLTYSAIDSDLSLTNKQEAAAAEAEELTNDDLNNIQTQDDSWYAIILAGASDTDILLAGKWVLNQRKRLFANSTTKGIEQSTDTENVAVELAATNNSRVVITHAIAGDPTGLISAWVGQNLPQTPGTNNWAFDTLNGQVADSFTSSATLTMMGNPVAGTTGRGVNIYTSVGGQPITQMGTSIDGSYIDIGIGVDWLFFNLQSNVYGALVGGGKVPMTDAGVAILKAAVRNVLDQGVANGLIDGTQAISVTAAKVATLPKSQRAARRAPTINFSCVLQGAVNAVTIAGTVSV